MSSLRISEDAPYIITLDSLDFKYIANHTMEIRPIWNNTKKEYYEFIVTDNEANEKNHKDDMECQTCHICDVEVPVIFLNEHYSSEKHNSFQKLTEIALERAARSIETHIYTNKRNITNDIYYCAPCSTAVLKKNRWTHNKSKQHLKSQKNDENMSSLIQMYINGGINLKNDNEKLNLTNNDDIKLKTNNTTVDLANNDVKRNNSDNKEPLDSLKSSESSKTYCEIYTDTANNEHSKSKHPLSNIQTVKTPEIQLLTNNKFYKINHIIYGNNPTKVICSLCQVKIPNTVKNIDEHVKAKKHFENLMKMKTCRYYCKACCMGFDDLIVHTFNEDRLCKMDEK